MFSPVDCIPHESTSRGCSVVYGLVMLLEQLSILLRVNQKKEFSGISNVSVHRLAASVGNGYTEMCSVQYVSTKRIKPCQLL